MNFNRLPLIISVLGGLSLILVQQYLRPLHLSSKALGIFLGSAPDLIVGFCFPFSILITPKAFTKQAANKLFLAWCSFTLIALIALEIWRPFKGARTFDYLDLIASIIGVSEALMFYCQWLTRRLAFD